MIRPQLLAGEDRLPEPSQVRSREKRKRLKAAGLALFGAKGYENTSIDEIAIKSNLAVGGFYQHFRSKRQLLLVLMDELLERLSQLELRPKGAANIRQGIRALLSRALSMDLEYLGVYRAWREAAITDPELAQKESEIRAWTTRRVLTAFSSLQELPGARRGIDVKSLAHVMDAFFWNFLAQAVSLTDKQRSAWMDSTAHLIYHALFIDPPGKPGARKRKNR